MKIVELKLEPQKTGEGITAISLVKHPAIEENWIAFSKGEVDELKPNKHFAFKTIDEDQQVIAGPAMIPEKLIYRLDPDGNEYFVFFKQDTIRELSERFLLQGKQNNMTLEHQATLNDLSVVESWIVEDPKTDKSALYGFSLPPGTWFVKVKVLNSDVWDLVKKNDVAGFSVEGVFTDEIVKNSKREMKKNVLQGYLDKINALVMNEETPKTDPTPETDPKPEKFGTVEGEGQSGVIVITFPGEVLEPGAAITTNVDDTEVPVPTGEYVLSDGSVLVVAEEGVVGEIRAEEPVEEEMEKDGLKAEQLDALVDGIADIISKFQIQVGKDIAAAVGSTAEALRLEFNKPAEEVTPEVPGADANKKAVIKGLNTFVKQANTPDK